MADGSPYGTSGLWWHLSRVPPDSLSELKDSNDTTRRGLTGSVLAMIDRLARELFGLSIICKLLAGTICCRCCPHEFLFEMVPHKAEDASIPYEHGHSCCNDNNW